MQKRKRFPHSIDRGAVCDREAHVFVEAGGGGILFVDVNLAGPNSVTAKFSSSFPNPLPLRGARKSISIFCPATPTKP